MPQLDSLRFFAALAVVHLHWFYYFNYDLDLSFGAYRVPVFFVLSAFLITSILIKAKEDSSSIIQTVKAFTLRRLIRLAPIYYLFLLFLIRMDDGFVISNLWYYLTFNSNNFFFLNGGLIDRWTNHTWTLGVEVQFYLIFPIMFLCIPKQHELLLGLTMILASLLIKTYGTLHDIPEIRFLTPANFDNLGIGVILGVLVHRSNKTLLDLLSRFASILVVIFLALTAVFFYCTDGVLNIVGCGVFTSLFAALLVYKCSIGFTGVIGSVFNHRVFCQLGKMSYGIFLYHYISPFIFDKVLEKTGVTVDDRFILYAANLLFLAVIVFSSWYGIEKPFLKLNKYFLYHKHQKREMQAFPQLSEPL